MKLAIYHQPGSFSDRWIEFCENKKISYKIVDCFRSDIIRQLSDCDGLLWQFVPNDYRFLIAAKQILLSLNKNGYKTFPNTDTGWHYDDKLGQKYLLEAVNAPIIPTYSFFTKDELM